MLQNMSLRWKLFVLSALAMAALSAAVFTGAIGIRSGIRGVEEIGERRLPAVIAIQALREAQIALKSSTFETALWENDGDAQEQFDGIAKDKQAYWVRADAARKAYETIPKAADESELWTRFLKQWEAWKKIDVEIIALLRELAANREAAQQKRLFQRYFALGGQQRVSYLAAEKLLNEVVELNAHRVAGATQDAEEATQWALLAMLTVGAGAFVVTTALAFMITASILRQMGGDPALAVVVARSIADGDLRVAIPVKAGDQTSLLAAIAYMRENLRALIGGLLTSADDLSASAKALAQEVTRIAASGEEGALAAKSTANSVDDISARVGRIGDSAETALKLSDQAGQLSRQGAEVVTHAAAEMQLISESVCASSQQVQKLGDYSTQISAIVGVIKEISDQTNLLALNAAIEAARAGEQGRGFAVVADEVRKLAERTGQSTQEISTMIASIQHNVGEAVTSMHSGRERVDEGVRMARDATATMAIIQSGAQEARAAVDSIDASLREGRQSLREIAGLMAGIVRMVDDDAQALATMRQSAEHIDGLASRLASSAQRFNL